MFWNIAYECFNTNMYLGGIGIIVLYVFFLNLLINARLWIKIPLILAWVFLSWVVTDEYTTESWTPEGYYASEYAYIMIAEIFFTMMVSSPAARALLILWLGYKSAVSISASFQDDVNKEIERRNSWRQ